MEEPHYELHNVTRDTLHSPRELTVIIPKCDDWLNGGEKQILNKCIGNGNNSHSNSRKRRWNSFEQPESPKKIKALTKERVSNTTAENSPTGLSKKMGSLSIEKISPPSVLEHFPHIRVVKSTKSLSRKYFAITGAFNASSKEKTLSVTAENPPTAELSKATTEKPSTPTVKPSSVRSSRTTNSQTFRKTPTIIEGHLSTPPVNGVSSTSILDQVPWIQQFSPLGIDELALDPAKVKEVCNWIDLSLHKSNYTQEGLKNHKLLFIHGPTGSVKTTAIKVIAKEKCIGVSEFEIESTVSQLNGRYTSVLGQLQEFITAHSDSLSKETKKMNMDTQIVLVDVNTCFCSPNAKDKFNELIEKWLRKRTAYWPLVLTYTDELIVSDYETATG
ncbi:1070_t:CDS:1, partial [Acaulospora colombiana]